MKIGPKYKIARRLGSAVFEKTQTPKFTLNEQKRNSNRRFMRPKSIYGKQLIEKQKVRFTYLLTEKQFSKYVKEIIATKARNQSELLFQKLESRLDNVALRSGFLKSRPLAKQAVSHGHFTVNGKRVNVPSVMLKKGDKIAVREASKTKGLFEDIENTIKENVTPAWLKVNAKDMTIEVTGEPVFEKTNLHFDLQQVLEFYKR
jgi:small subunit ribosomal protein S4